MSKLDEDVGKGCMMIVGFLLIAIAIGAATNWIAGMVFFGVICLGVGIFA